MPHKTRLLLLISVLAWCFPLAARGQIKPDEQNAYLRLGDVHVTRYRVGATIEAKRGAVRNVLATVAVPLTCPEQEVELVEEDITDQVRSHDFRLLPNQGAKQMIVKIPHLPNQTEARAVLTFNVRTRTILPPEDTSDLVIPKRPSRDLKRYLGKSPMIDTKHAKIKKLSREIFANLDDGDNATEDATDPTDWQRVEAIYNYVQDTITYKEQDDKSALATLKDGHGDCQNISALFVAICRTNGIPARLVWVHEHNYPEFCLVDSEGKPHWFPCESSGQRAFGEMPLARVIMQKGDNFKVPERRKALRYVSDYMIGVPAVSGGGPPSHKFIRERL
ncbi:MAG: transglutaminase domain-containing protein [Planctomycetota bacterium]